MTVSGGTPFEKNIEVDPSIARRSKCFETYDWHHSLAFTVEFFIIDVYEMDILNNISHTVEIS